MFKFEMGEEVTLKAMLTPFWPRLKEMTSGPIPQKMMVIGRLSEECEGGIQNNYKVRTFVLQERGWSGQDCDVSALRDIFIFGEMELVSWDVALEQNSVRKVVESSGV